jgi:hypothetical protein
MRRVCLLCAIVAGLAATSAQAQPSNRTVLSVQPISVFFEVFNLELERVFQPSVSGAAGFTYWSFDEDEGDLDVTYLSVDVVKLRYYPSGTAPNGFSFGASAGFTRIAEDDPLGDETSVTAPGFGIQLEYSRLLGAQRRFYLGGGIGAKALFFDEDEFTDDDILARYPTARLAVGFAF